MLNQSFRSNTQNKQIKITFNNEIKTTSKVATFEDLVKYMFSENGLTYFANVLPGMDRRWECKNWFNFWYEDANRQTYAISDE